jgi:hypothetical protein
LEFMHANYPTPQLAARGENGLYQAEVQLNFFTLPHFATSSWGGRRYPPLAFTEHGTVMAATILNSRTAVEASVFVVRAFVQMRGALLAHEALGKRLDELEHKIGAHDGAILGILKALRELTAPVPPVRRRPIGFVQESPS